MNSATLVPATDSRWRRFLDGKPHDPYQLPEYAAVAALSECGAAAAFYAEEREQEAVLMPLLLRELPPELGAPASWRDAISPYGYAGPITTTGFPLDRLRRTLHLLADVAREHDIVSAFVRLNPLRAIPTTAFDQLGTVVNHGQVVYIDLSKTLDEFWAETRVSHRQDIVRLKRLGYTVHMDDWGDYPEFQAMYEMTMQRRSASAFYYFSDQYFTGLRDRLGDKLHLCTVRGPDGDIAAGGLFLVAGGIAEYHLSGTADAHRNKAPSKLMLDFARGWAKELGLSFMNLGGGFGGKAGSLHDFKRGFSPLQADFHTVRIVFDQHRYDELTRARDQLHPDETAEDAFFPSYRRPHPSPQEGRAAVRTADASPEPNAMALS